MEAQWGLGNSWRIYPVSTLVVLDFAWKHCVARLPDCDCIPFQPLLYWILLGSSLNCKAFAQLRNSFNPCCIGFCLEAHCPSRCYCPSAAVSTLVVLDFAWKQLLKQQQPKLRSFNPCCIGFCLEANRWMVHSRQQWECFNPCCIGFCLEAKCVEK